jgi:hypothetical protein
MFLIEVFFAFFAFTTLSGSVRIRLEQFIGRCTLIFDSPGRLIPTGGFFYVDKQQQLPMQGFLSFDLFLVTL